MAKTHSFYIVYDGPALEKSEMEIEAAIEEVLDHRSAARQIALPFEKK